MNKNGNKKKRTINDNWMTTVHLVLLSPCIIIYSSCFHKGCGFQFTMLKIFFVKRNIRNSSGWVLPTSTILCYYNVHFKYLKSEFFLLYQNAEDGGRSIYQTLWNIPGWVDWLAWLESKNQETNKCEHGKYIIRRIPEFLFIKMKHATCYYDASSTKFISGFEINHKKKKPN